MLLKAPLRLKDGENSPICKETLSDESKSALQMRLTFLETPMEKITSHNHLLSHIPSARTRCSPLQKASRSLDLFHFANDTSFLTRDDIGVTLNCFNDDLQHIDCLLPVNRLTLNINKNSSIVFGPQPVQTRPLMCSNDMQIKLTVFGQGE